MCLINGLRPAGATLRTNNEKELIILPGCYDTGIGIFNSRTHCIVSYHDLRKVCYIEDNMLENILKLLKR